ncbi:MAG: YitT family protein [Caloramator sp.]|nr:YitT family protein [Caloramator sp.]
MKFQNKLYKILKITFGSFIYAAAINIFIAPHRLLSGGIAGISLIMQYVTKIPSGYWVFIINLPLFIIGYRFINKEFIFLSFIGMISMSFFLIFTKNISSFIKVDDLIISTIFGAVISGIGMGIIFKEGASQGGTDIIAFIIKKNNGIKLSTLYFILNGVIVISEVFIVNIKLTLYTIVSMYIKAVVIDKIVNFYNKKKVLMILTSNEKKISKCVSDCIGKETILLYGENAYIGSERKVIYCIVNEKELSRIKTLIGQIDITAQMSVLEAIDIQGKEWLSLAV